MVCFVHTEPYHSAATCGTKVFGNGTITRNAALGDLSHNVHYIGKEITLLYRIVLNGAFRHDHELLEPLDPEPHIMNVLPF